MFTGGARAFQVAWIAFVWLSMHALKMLLHQLYLHAWLSGALDCCSVQKKMRQSCNASCQFWNIKPWSFDSKVREKFWKGHLSPKIVHSTPQCARTTVAPGSC
eukprot:4600725-Amphidinium_carterae.2